MENLLEDLQNLKISGTFWDECINLIQKSFCPQQIVALTRPCEEKDFEDYRNLLNKNLQEIHEILQRIFEQQLVVNQNSRAIKSIGLHLILIVGEQSYKNPWNTTKSLSLAQNILTDICRLFGVNNASEIFSDNNLSTILMILRPKLLKDTWKTYPGSVVCYEWILHQVEVIYMIKNIFYKLLILILIVTIIFVI